MRALGEGGWWTQKRFHAAGIVADPFCAACSSVARVHRNIGSLHFRFCCCPATKTVRDAYKDQGIPTRGAKRCALLAAIVPARRAHRACPPRRSAQGRIAKRSAQSGLGRCAGRQQRRHCARALRLMPRQLPHLAWGRAMGCVEVVGTCVAASEDLGRQPRGCRWLAPRPQLVHFICKAGGGSLEEGVGSH